MAVILEEKKFFRSCLRKSRAGEDVEEKPEIGKKKEGRRKEGDEWNDCLGM